MTIHPSILESEEQALVFVGVSRFFLAVGFSLAACGWATGQDQAPKPTQPTPTCVTSECHGRMLSGKVLHAPTAQKKCHACHTLADAAEHRFSLTVAPERLCTSCHVYTQRSFVHEPVMEGNCTGCHDPHGSDYRFHLVADPTGELCYRCHPAETFTKKKYVHGPVAAGACIVCHEAHSSWRPGLLVKRKQELCLSCHQDVVDRLELARHPHPPALKGQCLTCHDAHASDHQGQIKQGAPALCFSCHAHDAIKGLLETSRHVHGAVTTERSCTACHSGHGSSMPKLIAQPLMNLCFSCHDKPVESTDGQMLADMASLLKDNPDHHGPLRRADCTACHNPHASPNFRLLAKTYPEMFYADFDLGIYDLCFTCHLKEMVTMENSIGVTGFRNGERNLHFVHVNKKKKGRTCRACHEVHASKSPFHIREKVPFGSGGWEIEINFEKLPDGGRCAPGCHEEQTYRQSPGGVVTTQSGGRKADKKP